MLLGGCATAADVTGTATREDVVLLRADIVALQTSVRQARAQADALGSQVDSRVREQATETQKQVAALASRLDALATGVRSLGSRLDDLSARLETLSRQQRSAPPARPAPPAAGAPAPVPPSPPATSRPATGSLQPQDIYQAAYLDFSKGSYKLAIAGFREFLRRYPEDPLAQNAQYWVGEAHVSLARGALNAGQPERAKEEFEQAVQEFRKVIANYPRGDKAPSSLYKEALVLIELKQPQVAQARLQYLVDNFPQAAETPLARERLASLKDKGT